MGLNSIRTLGTHVAIKIIMKNKPWQDDVSSKYGAPMGRRSDTHLFGKCHLQCVPMVDGDYDQGGAYWGGGRGVQPLWCAWNDDEEIVYFRALNRQQAKDYLINEFIDVTFYR